MSTETLATHTDGEDTLRIYSTGMIEIQDGDVGDLGQVFLPVAKARAIAAIINTADTPPATDRGKPLGLEALADWIEQEAGAQTNEGQRLRARLSIWARSIAATEYAARQAGYEEGRRVGWKEAADLFEERSESWPLGERWEGGPLHRASKHNVDAYAASVLREAAPTPKGPEPADAYWASVCEAVNREFPTEAAPKGGTPEPLRCPHCKSDDVDNVGDGVAAQCMTCRIFFEPDGAPEPPAAPLEPEPGESLYSRPCGVCQRPIANDAATDLGPDRWPAHAECVGDGALRLPACPPAIPGPYALDGLLGALRSKEGSVVLDAQDLFRLLTPAAAPQGAGPGWREKAAEWLRDAEAYEAASAALDMPDGQDDAPNDVLKALEAVLMADPGEPIAAPSAPQGAEECSCFKGGRLRSLLGARDDESTWSAAKRLQDDYREMVHIRDAAQEQRDDALDDVARLREALSAPQGGPSATWTTTAGMRDGRLHLRIPPEHEHLAVDADGMLEVVELRVTMTPHGERPEPASTKRCDTCTKPLGPTDGMRQCFECFCCAPAYVPKAGDRVQAWRAFTSDEEPRARWVPGMADYVGRVGTVDSVRETYADVEFDDGKGWLWHIPALRPTSDEPGEVET